MEAARIDPIHVLEDAILLDDEHLDAQAVHVVDLLRRELGERREVPVDQAVCFAPATFARCSHISTTVSGLRDMDSMPSGSASDCWRDHVLVSVLSHFGKEAQLSQESSMPSSVARNTFTT